MDIWISLGIFNVYGSSHHTPVLVFYMTTQMLNGFFICVLHGDKSGPRINLRLEDLLSFETLFKRSGLFFINHTPLDKRHGSNKNRVHPGFS
jgi:hypothetical protein